ncbi:hypothetical protein EDD85DRAFT_979680 [Armillaria nabsnona]|nr:hypothetical protein EDD85DRAFT_979680 [Armillaria nabsnona]
MDNDVAHPYLKYKYMWTNATDKDIVFVEGDRTLSGVATLSEHFCRQLHAAVEYAVKRSGEARDPPVEPWKFVLQSQYLDYLTKRPNLLQRIVKDGPLLVSMGIHSLETLKLDPGTFLLTVGMIQSFWIELCGSPWVIYTGVMPFDGWFYDVGTHLKAVSRAGIPVYLIRLLSTLPDREVLDTVGLTYFPIETERTLLGSYNPITTDTASDSRKVFAYNHFIYADPFSTTFGRWPLLSPVKSGSTCSVKQNPLFSSSKSKTVPSFIYPFSDRFQDSSQHLDKFLELTGDYAPSAINPWFHANAVKVNRFSAKSQQSKHLPSDASYFFLDPHLFLDVSNRERVSYLHMWKQLSTFWKYRASCNKPDARPLSSEEWRDLLGIPSKTSTEPEIQKQAEAFLGPSPDDDGVSYHLNVSDFNLPIEKKEAVELVWEIWEINFRFELLSLYVRAVVR